MFALTTSRKIQFFNFLGVASDSITDGLAFVATIINMIIVKLLT